MNPVGKQSLNDITLEDLEAILSGDPEELGVHLQLVDRDIVVDGHKVSVHCHCLTLDGNGQINPGRLAEFMRNSVADYAIPRSKMKEAKERDATYNSTALPSCFRPPQPVEVWDVDPVFYASPEGLSFSA